MRTLLIAAFAAAVLPSSASAAPSRIGGVYQEYISTTCNFSTCFVQFAALTKPLVVENVSCHVTYAKGGDIEIVRIALGDMAPDGNLTSFTSLALLAPVDEMAELNGQATVQLSVGTLAAVQRRRRPAVYIEFSRDTAAFLKCGVAGTENRR